VADEVQLGAETVREMGDRRMDVGRKLIKRFLAAGVLQIERRKARGPERLFHGNHRS
jgi:hypothetical protein